jgi:prepilin-type N-terminal cleavage/methylation domain-containing protein
MKQKLKSKRGFSLSEMLMVLLIMSLVGAAIGVGISAGARAYIDVTDSSEASILCSTLATELMDELRFAQDIQTGTDDALTSYTSQKWGTNVAIAAADGRVTIGGKQILDEEAYTGLQATATVTYTGGLFHVTIDVSRAGGATLQSTTFQIRAINA